MNSNYDALAGGVNAFGGLGRDFGRLGRLGVLGGVIPSWVVNRANPPDIAIDWTNNRAWKRAGGLSTAAALVTVSRASTGYVNDSSGAWTSIANNLPRISDLGLLVEEARTNSALWCRDMTNAAWIKTTMTAALNAVGIDNTANAATTLTATLGNATILQTTALAASTDSYSVFLKRVTGSGTINITGNGGVAWTACPALSTTAWTRCSIAASAFGLNPVIGIQIVSNGDVIIADFNQLEVGSSVTSPILTTTVAVARAADVVTLTTPPTFGSGYTVYAKGVPPASGITVPAIFDVSDGTLNNRVILYRGSGNASGIITAGGTGILSAAQAAWTVSGKTVLAYAASDQAFVFNGAAPSTASSALVPSGLNRIDFGTQGGGSNWWNGFIEYAAIWATQRVPNAQLQSMTT